MVEQWPNPTLQPTRGGRPVSEGESSFGRRGRLSYLLSQRAESRRMFHPAHVDGRSLVILRRRGRRIGPQFSVVAGGRLAHDGETLSLVGDGGRRVLSDQELASLMVVRPDTQIAACRGFDLFLVEESGA